MVARDLFFYVFFSAAPASSCSLMKTKVVINKEMVRTKRRMHVSSFMKQKSDQTNLLLQQ